MAQSMPGGEVFILGDGNAAATKLEVPGGRRVVQIASKGGRMCAFLCADGALFVSGHKRFPVTRLVPVTCPEPLKSIACGRNIVAGISQSGALFTVDAWAGLEARAVAGIGAKLVEVKLAADEDVTLARDDSGRVWCYGASAVCSPTPEVVSDLSNIVAIDCGDKHLAAITQKGEVFVWGDNKLGTLGVKEASGDEFLFSPTAVSTLRDRRQRVTEICCGRSVTYALTAEGAVWAWGFGKHNVLLEGDASAGDGASMIKANTVKRVPAVLNGIPPLASVSFGINHVAAVTRSRELITWGSSDCGKLGRPVASDQADAGPAKVKTPGPVMQAACGATFTLILVAC